MNKLRISIVSILWVFVLWLFPMLAPAQVRELASPAGPGSGQPNLAAWM